MKKLASLLLSSLVLLFSCTKDSSPDETTGSPTDNKYKNEITACECSKPVKDSSSEYIRADINGIPVCADVKGGFSDNFDNMFKYGLIKRTTGNTYYDNLYMIRNTRDGKFQVGFFLENTHLLTKSFPYSLPRANPEYCEIGELQMVNLNQITNSMCFQCSWSDWHYLGPLFGNGIRYTADSYENGYLEGHFYGSMYTGSGRLASVTNGKFRIRLVHIQADVIVP